MIKNYQYYVRLEAAKKAEQKQQEIAAMVGERLRIEVTKDPA